MLYFGYGEKKDIIPGLTVFETKNEMRGHIWFTGTCNIFRVRRVIVRMPYLPSRKVRWPNSICPSFEMHIYLIGWLLVLRRHDQLFWVLANSWFILTFVFCVSFRCAFSGELYVSSIRKQFLFDLDNCCHRSFRCTCDRELSHPPCLLLPSQAH